METDKGIIRHRLMQAMEEMKHVDQVLVTKALTLAESVHAKQYRKPHKVDPVLRFPYIVHPMRIACILLDELNHREPETLCVALLHDTVEDSDGKVTTGMLEEQFGRTIALMVSVLTKPAPDKKISRVKQLETYHERLLQSATSTKIVKLCDRLDNIRECLLTDDEPFQRRYLMETLQLYLPLAHSTNEYLHSQILECCGKLSEMVGYEGSAS